MKFKVFSSMLGQDDIIFFINTLALHGLLYSHAELLISKWQQENIWRYFAQFFFHLMLDWMENETEVCINCQWSISPLTLNLHCDSLFCMINCQNSWLVTWSLYIVLFFVPLVQGRALKWDHIEDIRSGSEYRLSRDSWVFGTETMNNLNLH